MAEVKAEAACDGETVESEIPAGFNLPMVDPAFSNNSSVQVAGEVSKSLEESVKAPTVSVESEPKDFPGSESIIPLSPQWLFSKHGDGKPLVTPIDLPQAPASASNGNSSDSVSKERWRPDGNRDADKRRDWWRTTGTESDGSGGNRRERWKDDERESSSLGRRERWKEGGAGDNTDRRVDRWAENTSTVRESAENRRTPHPERRSDSTNRETTYETRRDSKWNTRWGPEDKEKDIKKDKRMDFEKEGEGHRDKHPSTHRNEVDREVDTSARDRWRPHSITARSKGEVPPPLSSTPPKAAAGFGIGRGRGDTTTAGFAVGRGRANLSGINPSYGVLSSIGSPPGLEKGDGGLGFRYPRAKLLDIYRKCSGSSSDKKYPEGFNEVPQLTQSEHFEPLAVIRPDLDEEVVLEGIRKGDVLTSGAVHTTPKEQTNNKSRDSSGWNRPRGRTIGNKEDLIPEAGREDSSLCVNLAPREDLRPQNGAMKENDTLAATYNERASVNAPGLSFVKEMSDTNPYYHSASESYKPIAILESNESKKLSIVGENSDTGAFSGSVPVIEGQNSLLEPRGNYDEKMDSLDKLTNLNLNKSCEADLWSRTEGKKPDLSSQRALEEISLFYIDPQGVVQGPFSGVDIMDWFKAGFFGTDLMVRTADSPESAPFTQLSKIMPHLQGTTHVSAVAAIPNDDLEYQESNDRATKVSLMSNFMQQAVSDTPGRTMRVGNLQAGGGHLPVNSGIVEGRRDMAIGKVPEHERLITACDEAALLKRASSLPQRMAGLSQIHNDDLQSVLQYRSERGSPLPDKPGLIPRSIGYPSGRAEFFHGGPEMLLPSVGSTSLDRSWSDLSSLKETMPHQLPLHGPDAFQMHRIQQLEMQRAQQQQWELRRAHQLRQQLAEQRRSSGHEQHDMGLHALQQLANPHMLPRLQHQHSLPVQSSEPSLDQLFRPHQQQPQNASHPFLEKLWRHQQQFPGADHLHGSPMMTDRQLRALQEAVRTDDQAQQVEQYLQRHAQELLVHRQLEQAHLLRQQQLASQRMSGVWEEGDELGQFVQTQVPNPIHSADAFHQQQSQRHQSFSPMQHLGALHGGVSVGHNPQLRLSRSELRKLLDVEMKKNLLDGTSSMPDEKLAQLQSAIAMFELQNVSIADKSFFEPHTYNLLSAPNHARLNGEGLASRPLNASHDLDKQVKEMRNRGASSSSLFDQLSAKSEQPIPIQNWQQDSLSLQTDASRRLKAFAAKSEESLETTLRSHSRSEKLVDQAAEDLRVLSSRSLSSRSLSGQRGSSPSSTFHDQQVMTSLWAGEHVPLDNNSSSAQTRLPQPPLFESAGSLKPKHWDMDWSKADTSHARELSSEEASKIPIGLGHDVPGLVEARSVIPALLHDSGNLGMSNDPRECIQHSSFLKVDDHQSSALFNRTGSVNAEDFRELLPSTSSHILGDAQLALENNAATPLTMWSTDVKNQMKTINSVKEIQELPRVGRNELEASPLLQGQMQANSRVPSNVSLPGSVLPWQRAPSPSLRKIPAPSHHITTIRSTTPGDDEFFWDHNTSGNARPLSRAEFNDKLFSPREQFGKAPSVSDEVFIHQAFAAGSTCMPGQEFSSAVTRPVQTIARGTRGAKQTDEVPHLNSRGSLTVADAKAFREWCAEQINLRRESALENDPACNVPKAEFSHHEDSMLSESLHAPLPAAEINIGDKVVAGETGTTDRPKKSSEGEEEPDSDPSAQGSALKGAKKKAKKGKKVVDPSLLGFSVASSNRILMGEIQHVDD